MILSLSAAQSAGKQNEVWPLERFYRPFSAISSRSSQLTVGCAGVKIGPIKTNSLTRKTFRARRIAEHAVTRDIISSEMEGTRAERFAEIT